MKILTLCGTRPELIRLSIIIEKLDNILKHNHIFVYTNQNFDDKLSGIFFRELKIREPDFILDNQAIRFSEFLSYAIFEFDRILDSVKPDKILVLGDTNSGLLSILAQKRNIPIYHMEAGNRCFDLKVPEEINRRIIDNVSTYNLPYTETAKNNLLNEGFNKNFIFKTGNPIMEIIEKYDEEIYKKSNILKQLNLKELEYVLVTCHRSENQENISELLTSLMEIGEEYKVIFSLHPRTRRNIQNGSFVSFSRFQEFNIHLLDPFGFFDFVKLESNAKMVITDSGTVQEECCIIGTPCIVIRESTERNETIECGASILTGINLETILNSFNYIKTHTQDDYIDWKIPDDYTINNVSDIVINILMGK